MENMPVARKELLTRLMNSHFLRLHMKIYKIHLGEMMRIFKTGQESNLLDF